VVQAVNRAFFLGGRDLPGRPFLSGPVSGVTLTPQSPTAVLYRSS
jgi:hypothetical protein